MTLSPGPRLRRSIALAGAGRQLAEHHGLRRFCAERGEERVTVQVGRGFRFQFRWSHESCVPECWRNIDTFVGLVLDRSDGRDWGTLLARRHRLPHRLDGGLVLDWRLIYFGLWFGFWLGQLSQFQSGVVFLLFLFVVQPLVALEGKSSVSYGMRWKGEVLDHSHLIGLNVLRWCSSGSSTASSSSACHDDLEKKRRVLIAPPLPRRREDATLGCVLTSQGQPKHSPRPSLFLSWPTWNL